MSNELKKALKEVDKEIEDKAWAAKRAEYGPRFNAPKFYELERFWPNFFWWSVVVLFIFIPFILLSYKLCQTA